MSTHVFTSFSFSYLNRARVLASSLKRQHPDWTIWAIITDKEPKDFKFDISAEDFDHTVYVDDLFGEHTDSWLFSHDVVEACTAVKGHAILHIMDHSDATKVLYFDPDTAVFNSISPIIELLDEYSIVLTPHQIDPDTASSAIMDNEIASLQYGVFNLGFIAVKNDKEGRRFAGWWAERLFSWCHDRLDIGVFVDQKWCNLIPCFFDNVKVLRDPGYNVASWNISQRKVGITPDGAILVNDLPLRFFHFTKLGPIGDAMTQRYAAENVEVYEVWRWYREEIQKFTESSIPNGWWFYGKFNNGKDIPKKARELYRTREDLKAAFPQPQESGAGSFYEWLIGSEEAKYINIQ